MINDNLYKDLLVGTFLGEVVNNEDPDFEQKIQIRVFSKYDDIEDEYLPWASNFSNNTSGSKTGAGSHSIPKIGSLVEVEFENNNIYHPVYKNIRHISDELKDKIGNDDYYKNAQVLLYDTETNVYLYHIKHKDGGLILRTFSDKESGSNQIWFKESNEIQIKNKGDAEITLADNILISLKNGKTIDVKQDGISIGSKNKSAEPATMGNKNAKLHQDAIGETINIVNSLTIFSESAGAVCKVIPFLAPLAPSFEILAKSLIPVNIKLNLLKSKDAPLTKSKIVTID